MDPNTILDEAIKLAKRIQRSADSDNAIDDNDAEALAEKFLALNDWLKRGGFLPNRWIVKG